MEKTFEGILEDLLSSYEACPQKNAEEIVDSILKKYGASEDALAKSKKANIVITKIQEKTKELSEFQESKEKWVNLQMQQLKNRMPEEDIIKATKAFESSYEKQVEEAMTKK